jgi:hypothetical protein
MLLYIGLVAFFMAAIVGSLAFIGESAERAGVSRSLATI